MESEKVMISIDELKAYMNNNKLNLFEKQGRNMTGIDTDDLIELLKYYAKSKVNLLPSYLLISSRETEYLSIEELKEYINILDGNTELNPEFVFTKEECENNIQWAKEKIDRITYESTHEYLLENRLKREKEKKEKTAKFWKDKETANGFVYIITDGEEIKIGRTKYLSQRLTTIAYERKKDIKLIHSLFVSGYELREKQLHKMFEHKNTKGEWFLLNDRDIETAKEYLKLFEVDNTQKQHLVTN